MIAAIYARKSTDQHGVADEQKSVVRQIAHARAYASAKGWLVLDEHVYVDDGISGAEFTNRPAFLRLMNALKPRPPFTALVMSEVSRLGREQIETAYALKQLSVAGVRCFSHLEDRELLMESATDKFLLGAVTFAADLEREKARQRTYDALVRKARAGHVAGGRVFGYTNVRVEGHVERRINEAEAAIIRRVFHLCAEGIGQTRIAKQLNAEGAVAPRAQQGRPTAWSPATVHEVLFRELYRGVIVWNKSQKRNRWGQQERSRRPAHEWIRIEAPTLRILSDAQWDAAHRRIADARAVYDRMTHGQRRRYRDLDSKYLLPGFGRCALCGGGLHIRSRAHGRGRAFFYACTSHYNRGPSICPHVEQWPMGEIDHEVIAEIVATLIGSVTQATEDIVAEARRQYRDHTRTQYLERLRRELQIVDREQTRLPDAIASAGDEIPILVERLRATEAKRRTLQRQITDARQNGRRPAWREIERRLRRSLTEWRSLLLGDVAQVRQAFRRLLTAPILFTPVVDRGRRAIRFEGRIGLAAVFGGQVGNEGSSPRRHPVRDEVIFRGIWCS